MNQEKSIQINNISHAYEGVFALHDISFDALKGTITAILGPNGAGKTTLLKLICQLINNQQGSIKYYINEEEVKSKTDILKSIGYVPQQPILWNDLTCVEHMELIAGFYQLRNAKRLNYLLNLFDISHHRYKKAKYLSGGMQKKLNCAMALIRSANYNIR